MTVTSKQIEQKGVETNTKAKLKDRSRKRRGVGGEDRYVEKEFI